MANILTASEGRCSGSRISRKMTFSVLASVLSIAAFATESRAANWTGCNVGVSGGFSTVTAEPVLFGVDGTQIGLGAGCDYQVDRLVFGALAGYDWKTFDVGGAGEIDATALTFGARAGVLLGGDSDTLAYGLLAFTNTEVDDSDDDVDGFAYGAGIESVVYRNRGGFLTLKGEARRIDHDLDGLDLDGLDATETTVTAGLSYHFGGGVPIVDDARHPIK
jgi:hypothetical protein